MRLICIGWSKKGSSEDSWWGHKGVYRSGLSYFSELQRGMLLFFLRKRVAKDLSLTLSGLFVLLSAYRCRRGLVLHHTCQVIITSEIVERWAAEAKKSDKREV